MIPYVEKPRTEKQFNNLYVKNFSRDLSDEDFAGMFKQFGEITSAVVMKDDAGHSKGFGFVCFSNPEDARNALSLNGVDNLHVCEAKSKEQRREEVKRERLAKKRANQFCNLIARGLDNSITQEQLFTYFTQFGQVTSIKIGPTPGVAFINFTNREGARIAKEAKGSGLRGPNVYVDFCQIKEVREAQMEELQDRQQYDKIRMG